MSSPVGLPNELKRELDYQLPQGVSITPIKIVPTNVSSVVSPTSSALTASSANTLQGTAQDVIFEFPCNQGKSVFLDHRYTTLSFRANYEVVSAGTSQIITNANLRSNALSFFDTATLFGQNGLVLDQINQYGLVSDTLLQLETDIASRDCISMAYGLAVEAQGTSSQNNNQGHEINKWRNGGSAVTTGSQYYSYCVPLINSLIGRDAKKFFNIGSTNRLQFVLRTSSVLPVTLVAGTSTAGATLRITLDNFQINTCLIDVGQEGLKMLGAPELQYFNGITYRVSSTTLPAGSSGQLSILTGQKGSSVRGIITRCSDNVTSTSGSVNERFDSKLLPATAVNYNINGVRIPSNPIDVIHNPALSWMCLQECNSAFNPYDFKSSIIPQQYCIYTASSSLPTDMDYYVSSSTTSATSLASWMFGYSLEKVSKSGILDGANCNAGNVYFEANLGSASLTNANTLYFISKLDIIYVLDTRTGEIQVRM